jgi:hypothetical protein
MADGAEHGVAADRLRRARSWLFERHPVSRASAAAELHRSASGGRERHSLFGLLRRSRLWNARRVGPSVQALVVLRVVQPPVVLSARCASVVRALVVRSARCEQPDRVLDVVRLMARCAWCDPKWAWFRSWPVVLAWHQNGVVGTYGWHPERDRPEPPNMSFQPTASRARSFGF